MSPFWANVKTLAKRLFWPAREPAMGNRSANLRVTRVTWPSTSLLKIKCSGNGGYGCDSPRARSFMALAEVSLEHPAWRLDTNEMRWRCRLEGATNKSYYSRQANRVKAASIDLAVCDLTEMPESA